MKNRYLIVFFILFLVALVNFWRVPFLFWQQDEWVTFANLIQSGINITLHGLDIKSTHFSPISNFITYLCFKVFGFWPFGYLIIGLVLHLINGFLVYKIAQKLIPNFFYSLIAAVLFVGSSASYQLLMWPMISLNAISLTFTLLATLVLINFIIKKDRLWFWGTIEAFLSAFSLFTIEYSGGLLLFIPITLLFYYKRLGFAKITKFLIPLFLFMIFFFWFRFYYTTPLNVASAPSQTNQNLIIRKSIRYPFYYLGQIYAPENIIVQISKIIAKTTNTNENLYILKVALVFSVLILLLTFYTMKKVNLEKYSDSLKIILITFLFIVSSSLPFVLLSGNSGDFTIFPSRYLYFGSAGGALLLALLLYYSKVGKVPYIFTALSILTVTFISLSTNQNLQKSKDLYDKGEIRKSILETIQSKYPKLPKKTVFYFQSDTSYYGLPPQERILPFQGGLGQILLMWYSSKSNFPTKFYQNEYLWDITSENYMEVEDFGYGYFKSWDKLQHAIDEHNLPPQSVIAFSWNGETNTLSDITLQVRKKLQSENLTK